MLNISILGATGKVGAVLLAEIAAAPDLALDRAISASGKDGSVTLGNAELDGSDVIIDFSTPLATMALLDRISDNAVPLVVGTTGFDTAQTARLRREGDRRPLLVGANFTKGFEAFLAAGHDLARALPGASLTVGEIYNARKKPAPSGTTQRLCRELGAGGRPVAADIQRIGDIAGVNTISLDYGVATIRLELTVHSRAAYAAGALEAAKWLIPRAPGFYQPKDMLSD